MMKKQEVMEALKAALETDLTEDSCTDNVDEWDSLGQLTILAALNELSGGKTDELTSLSTAESVAEIFDILTAADLIED